MRREKKPAQDDNLRITPYHKGMNTEWARISNRVALSRKDLFFLVQEKPRWPSLFCDRLLFSGDDLCGFLAAQRDENSGRIRAAGVLPGFFPEGFRMLLEDVVAQSRTESISALRMDCGDEQYGALLEEAGFQAEEAGMRFFCKAPPGLESRSAAQRIFCDHVFAECSAEDWGRVRAELDILSSPLTAPVRITTYVRQM